VKEIKTIAEAHSRLWPKSTLTVALCTYNGAPFLQEQLESIVRQTRLPDEIVICDDSSSDSTGSILQEFARVAPCPVRLFLNGEKLGVTKNFEKVIGLANGDVIALADQDDVWYQSKLEKLELSLANAVLAFSDADVVDENLRPLGYKLWEVVGFHGNRLTPENDLFRVLLRGNCVMGASLAFRRDIRDFILPIPGNWVHDAWIAILVSAVAPAIWIDKPLLAYRQHGKNQIGGRQENIAARIRRNWLKPEYQPGELVSQFEEALNRLGTYQELEGIKHEGIQQLREKITHLKRRRRVVETPVVGLAFLLSEAMSMGYHRYSRGWATVVKDGLLNLRNCLWR
jgi:glycosyltransferase involved in cell wall biosynthesis